MDSINNLIIEESIVSILKALGEDPKREGLKDTPKRVRKSYSKLFEGYGKKAEDILITDFSECSNYDQMIISEKIHFYSMCEHHMLPFFGYAYVAYIPGKIKTEEKDLWDQPIHKTKVVGISKLSRLVDIHARRLQIQERMTQDIADDIQRILKPAGIGVIIKAQHFCMTARGVEKQESKMTTSAMTGVFREDNVRQEFLQLIKI